MKIKERNQLQEIGKDDDTEYDKILHDIKILRAKKKMIESSSDTIKSSISMKASRMMDIWGFGVTFFYLCTKKKSLFRFDQNDDTLENEEEKSRLVNWNGPSTEDLNKLLPNCSDQGMKMKVKAFFLKCLYANEAGRFQDFNEVLNHPLFTGNDLTNCKLEEIRDIVKIGQATLRDDVKDGFTRIDKNFQIVVKSLDMM